MNILLITFTLIFTLEAILAIVLTVLPRLGYLGKDLSEACTKAPLLDFILSVMLWIPWLVGALMAGWFGLGITLVAQILVMQIWCFVHASIYRQSPQDPRIYGFMNQKLGWWRNNLALWVTAVVVPVFFAIRFAEVFCYTPLAWMVGFPNYKHRDWVNVSRQKFEGLVGQDLIWCLYCDWMTGVYSLGAEMLRNVESFWCPIRFYDDKKCENCKLDFPDIERGWVAKEGTMEDVEEVLKKMYANSQSSWFGHPEREHPQVEINQDK
jgi:hypothetical protein